MKLAPAVCLCLVCAIASCSSTPAPAPADSGTPKVSATASPAPTAPSAALGATPTAVPTYGEGTVAISVEVGQPFVLSLPANVTTPYKWIVDSSVDSGALELVRSEYSETPSEGCSGCLGAGGRRLLTFQAKRAGTSTLALSYQSITDPTEAPVNRFQATIQAK